MPARIGLVALTPAERQQRYRRFHAVEIAQRMAIPEVKARQRAAEKRVQARRTPELRRRYEATYRARYPGRRELLHREKQRRRAARLRTGRVDYAEVIRVFGMVCHICHLGIEQSALHFDHVIPLSKGGLHTMGNVRPAHKLCNLKKSDKLL